MRRNSNRIKCVFNAVAAALAVAVVAGCSTTRRLPAGEVLYTGVYTASLNLAYKLAQYFNTTIEDIFFSDAEHGRG